MRAELDLTLLLVTRGEQGMTLFEQGAEPLTLPAQAREVFDVTGAGDTVIALFGAGVAAGLAAADAAALANLGAGIVVGKIGVATVTRSELRRAFEMGFMLFLPFLIIDMVTASILMSMGMMMLPPVVISLPFKLIFFVLVDGWHLVAGSLVRSFTGS